MQLLLTMQSPAALRPHPPTGVGKQHVVCKARYDVVHYIVDASTVDTFSVEEIRLSNPTSGLTLFDSKCTNRLSSSGQQLLHCSWYDTFGSICGLESPQ